jgi:hypothetical protein
MTMDNQEWNQAMLERQQMLEGALLRAQDNRATDNDWDLIWWECGLYERRQQLKGSKNVSNS